MIPLLMLAAGIIAQQDAKRQTIQAQRGVLSRGQAINTRAQTDVSNEVGKEIAGSSFENRAGQEQAAINNAQATNQANDRTGIGMFEAAGGDSASAAAVGAQAAQRGGARAALAAPGVAANERRRLGLDINDNIAGVRQRAQRSLGLLPDELDNASRVGANENMIGGLLASYGAGGLSSSASQFGKQNANQDYNLAQQKKYDPEYAL